MLAMPTLRRCHAAYAGDAFSLPDAAVYALMLLTRRRPCRRRRQIRHVAMP